MDWDLLKTETAKHLLSVTMTWYITDSEGNKVMRIPKGGAVKLAIEYAEELVAQLQKSDKV